MIRRLLSRMFPPNPYGPGYCRHCGMPDHADFDHSAWGKGCSR